MFKRTDKIFQYTLRERREVMSVLVIVMTGLTFIALLLIGLSSLSNVPSKRNFITTMFFSMAVLVNTFAPVWAWFYCGNGYVDHLIKKDTNYLMLSLPVSRVALLFGRWLAGVVETAVYFLAGCTFNLILVTIGIHAENGVSYGTIIRIYGMMIQHNVGAMLILFTLFFLLYILVGSAIMLITTFIHSFVRNKRLAKVLGFVCGIIAFVLLSYLTGDGVGWADWAHFTCPIVLVDEWGVREIMWDGIRVPLVTVALWFVLSIGFFIGASWLLEKKVEV